MASSPAELILANYQRRVDAIHTEVRRRVDALYGATIDPDDIDASFRRYIEAADPVLTGAQAATSQLAAAFLRAYTLARAGDLIEIDVDEAGTTVQGKPLAEGMAAFGPMVLARIRDGLGLDEAIEFGRYLATRFADNEMTAAADRVVTAELLAGRFRSWEGIVQGGACDPCLGNAGVHPIDEEIYRHPGCRCVYVALLDIDGIEGIVAEAGP